MSNMKHCPHCHCSMEVVRIGTTTANRQRYLCKRCKKTWTNSARPSRMETLIHEDYFVHDLKLNYLCKKYGYSTNKIRGVIDKYQAPRIVPSGQHDVIGIDCIYFGKRGVDEWGLMIVLDLHTEECLYCEELPGHETYAHYYQAIRHLNLCGVFPKACVIDGTPGVPGVLRNACILTQYCRFHQIRTVNTYLTKNPILEPNIELRRLVCSLTHTNRQTFIANFKTWQAKYGCWLNERTGNPETGKLEYAHRKTRSAASSIKRNLPFLFTYEQCPIYQIPNTNNILEGTNSAIKSKLSHHRGAKKELKIKLVRTFLSGRTGV